MKRTLTTLMLLLGLCTGAQAALVYSFTSNPVEFKFTTTDFLTSPTVLQSADLFDVINNLADETLDSVNFMSPGFVVSGIEMNFPGGSPLISIIYSFVGPFDHLGTYISYGLTGPSDAILTITEAAVEVPEPGSLLLLAAALAALSLTLHRKPARQRAGS
ncbi:PEP-CTERM sorting domain-containing protein [Hydrogenophaga sp.]|uniref:PEP-CTERM sorting domain-containing protein n=1 Tax=Hydrogenophaga sp. TaxID=1904254 RepID=UPI0025C1085A|nr:PEP-CTERM sorting domain-containing protein [Hydrogenophaga sp.]MBT9465346.1 PEP-CTERM sorting domain-containing protein [Hydrogenophaga sp.]